MLLPAKQNISAQQRQAWNEFSLGWQKWNARIQEAVRAASLKDGRVVFPWSAWVVWGTK